MNKKFDVTEYVDNKILQLKDFFIENKLDSVVFGLSGGIDSAVVLGLYCELQKRYPDVLKKILPLALPISNVGAVVNQDDATKYAILVNDKFMVNEPLEIFDLKNTFNEAIELSISNEESNDWAKGQMASVLRTPIFYYNCAKLQQLGYKSVVSGTCNKTEFLLGYWGKASDMMVDIQPIVDLYKTEVFLVAEYLKVPNEIINRKPTGDVSNGECDEETIGAPYSFIDKYLKYKNGEIKTLINWDGKPHDEWENNIDNHINRNYHKFQVGYPCHMMKIK